MTRVLCLTPAALMMVAATVEACTNDFDVFEGSQTSSGDGGASDGSSDGSSSDGARADAASNDAGGGGTDCTAKSSCFDSDKTCLTQCESTFTTCNNNCGGSVCKRKCSDDRDACVTNCHATCTTCAGPSCAASCP